MYDLMVAQSIYFMPMTYKYHISFNIGHMNLSFFESCIPIYRQMIEEHFAYFVIRFILKNLFRTSPIPFMKPHMDCKCCSTALRLQQY